MPGSASSEDMELTEVEMLGRRERQSTRAESPTVDTLATNFDLMSLCDPTRTHVLPESQGSWTESLKKLETEKAEKLDSVVRELESAYHEPEYEHLELMRQRSDALLQYTRIAEVEIKAIINDLQQQVQLAEQKLMAAEAEGRADEQWRSLESSLANAREAERKLRDEARAIEEHVEALGEQLTSIRTQKEVLSRMDTEQLRTKRELSLFLQLTKTIPHSIETREDGFVSGSIMVGAHSQGSEIFSVDTKDHSPFEICNYLWDKVCLTDN